MVKPTFFETPEEWREWLEENHAEADDILVGFHKAHTKRGGLTYKQALDEALCFGWIDAVRRGGTDTWTIRFTPRKFKSIWSQVNIRRVGELTKLGRMHQAGLKVFQSRDPERQNKYSFENRDKAVLSPTDEKSFRADKTAWAWFEAAPRSYRVPAIWWVVSAKKPETHERRLAALIADSAAGRRLRHLTRPDERA